MAYPTEPDSDNPPAERAFRVLANRQRRLLLLALLNHNPRDDVPVSESPQGGFAPSGVGQIEYFQTHLPLLEEDGYIEWDRESEEVSKGPNFDELLPLLDLLDQHGDELPDDWF